jgi:hypothetical protein
VGLVLDRSPPRPSARASRQLTLTTSRRSSRSARRREPPPHSRCGGRRLAGRGASDLTSHLEGRADGRDEPAAIQIETMGAQAFRPCRFRAWPAGAGTT